MLSIRNLRKTFDRVVAVDDISLEVHRGEVYGLLGPNGAGKTTTIRTVLDIIKPDSGEITFDGRPFSKDLWNLIGYLPEERGLYKKSKVLSTILYFAALKGVSEHEAKQLAARWLERFDLMDAPHRKVEELSKGNQQKVQLITALIHDPQLLVFDEPFSGLDPVNQILLKDILLELRKKNVAIIFSTHQMEQVERLCDNLSLINKGKVVLQGSLRDIKKSHGSNTVLIEFEGDGSFLGKLKGVVKADIYANAAELRLSDISASGSLLAAVTDKLDVKKFEVQEPSLQSIFVSVVGGEETIERAASQSIAGIKRNDATASPRKGMDKELRKLLMSVGIVGVILAVQLWKGTADPAMFGLMAAVLGVVGFKYYKARSKAKNDGGEEGRNGA